MTDSSASTEPVQIVQSNDANMITLDETALENILTQDAVKDKLVSVISVVGTYRQGKSYLLNFMHRYLKHNYPNKNINEWLTPANGPLANVFSSVSGSSRQTDGIRMSKDIFLVKTEKGEVAIFLLDTQGSFDNRSTIDDFARIFAISSLINSVQVYNLMENFSQFDIDHLKSFASYAAGVANSKYKPFQDLWFLVRDWSNEFEHSYGVQGGEEYMADLSEGAIEKVQDYIGAIKALYNNVKCFLMPHPGDSVVTSRDFNGNLNDIDENFRRQMMTFIPMLLSSDNLVLKKVNNRGVTGGEIFQYIKGYNDILKSEEDLPKLDSFSKSMRKTQLLISKDAALNGYKNEMKEFLTNKDVTISMLREAHETAEKNALDLYQQKSEGHNDEDIYDEYLIMLNEEIEKEYERNKNIINERNDENERKVTRILQYVELATDCVNMIASTGVAAASAFSMLKSTKVVEAVANPVSKLLGRTSK